MKKIPTSDGLNQILISKTFVNNQFERFSPRMTTAQIKHWNKIREQAHAFLRHFWPSLEVSRKINKWAVPQDARRYGASFSQLYQVDRSTLENAVSVFEVESILVYLTFTRSLKIVHHQCENDFTYAAYRHAAAAFGNKRKAAALEGSRMLLELRLKLQALLPALERFGSTFNILPDPRNPQGKMWRLILSVFKEDGC